MQVKQKVRNQKKATLAEEIGLEAILERLKNLELDTTDFETEISDININIGRILTRLGME